MNNNLTDRIKSILLRQKLSINEDELLQDIFSELPPEKKKNRFLFIILTLGFIISAISIYTLGSYDVHSSNNQTSEKENINDNSTSRANDEAKTIKSIQKLADNSNMEKSDKTGQNDIDTDKEKEPKIEDASSANLDNSAAREISLNKQTSSGTQLVTFPISKEDASSTKEPVSTTSQFSNLLPIITKTNNSTLVLETMDNHVTQQYDSDQNQVISFDENRDARLESKMNAPVPLYQRSILPILIKSEILDFNKCIVRSPVHSEGFDVSKLQLELNGQGFYQKTDLKSIKSRPGYQIQILGKYKIKKFSPIIGLSFKRMNSVLDHTWSEERTTLSSNEADKFCPNDPTECLTYNDVIQTTHHVAYNHIDVINIPIGIEYQSTVRIGWWTRFLINIPIQSSFKFEYLDSNDDIIDLRNIENAKVDVAPEIQLSTGVVYRVFDNVDLRVGLQHGYSAKGVGINPAAFSISKSTLGGQLGINYWIR